MESTGTQLKEQQKKGPKIGIKKLGAGGVALLLILIAVFALLSNNATSTGSGKFSAIDQPLNASELSIINSEPISHYESAGEMLLNHSLANPVSGRQRQSYQSFLLNGKQSVIYIGAISCIMCGQNRWAMALALSRFGNFTRLYKGYSSAGEGGGVPTLYWASYNYTTSAGVGFGNFYNSKIINFFSADYESPITGGFEVQPLSYFEQYSPNSTYTSVLQFMDNSNGFQGTPFTFWGNNLIDGADALVFGNFSVHSISETPLSMMNHTQVLNQLSDFKDQFAWSEYAAADVYIALLCPSLNNTAQICSLPAIRGIEKTL